MCTGGERQARIWFVSTIGVVLLVFVAFVAQTPLSVVNAVQTTYVIHISIDGMRSSYLQEAQDTGYADNLKQLRSESAWTHNARTDFDYTITLPNHTSQLTGRPVADALGAGTGHAWMTNITPPLGTTLHTNGGPMCPASSMWFTTMA